VVDVILQLASPATKPGTITLLLQNGRALDPFAARKAGKQAPGAGKGGSGSGGGSSGGTAGPASGVQQERQRAAAAAWAAPGSRRSFEKVRGCWALRPPGRERELPAAGLALGLRRCLSQPILHQCCAKHNC
jgi:hypothetical protein